jgi:hypothetical protein
VTTGYEAGFYRDISELARGQKETNRLLERIAVAMEASLELVKQDMEIGTEIEL